MRIQAMLRCVKTQDRKDDCREEVRGVGQMYIRLVFYSGDRSLLESMVKDGSPGLVADRFFFLDAVDNDGDALRFQHNNGNHFDVIFLQKEGALSVYGTILETIRSGQNVLDMDIREKQILKLSGL